MKLNKLTTAALALALASALATSARAQVYTSYNSGDLLLGFEQAGNASDYLVDLGQVSQFIGATAPLTFDLSTADLSSIFGSSWASNSQTNLVQWGAIANDQGQSIASNTDGNSVWYTKGETVAGTPSLAPIRPTSSTLNIVSNKIQNLDTGDGGYDSSLSTANAANAIIQSKSAANSWSSFNPSLGTGLNLSAGIEQPESGSFTGPTDSVEDLYQVNSQTAANQKATLLGNFTLNSSGVLTFTEATQAVPEPASFALGVTAVLLFLVLKRRSAISSIA